MPPEKAEEIARIFTEGRWTHDYPITVEELRGLGFNVKTEIPKEIYMLMSLYPQSHQRRPGIEYLPLPMRPSTPEKAGR